MPPRWFSGRSRKALRASVLRKRFAKARLGTFCEGTARRYSGKAPRRHSAKRLQDGALARRSAKAVFQSAPQRCPTKKLQKGASERCPTKAFFIILRTCLWMLKSSNLVFVGLEISKKKINTLGHDPGCKNVRIRMYAREDAITEARLMNPHMLFFERVTNKNRCIGAK